MRYVSVSVSVEVSYVSVVVTVGVTVDVTVDATIGATDGVACLRFACGTLRVKYIRPDGKSSLLCLKATSGWMSTSLGRC